jgi:amino acid transporter
LLLAKSGPLQNPEPLGGFTRVERSTARNTMTFFPVKLGWVAFAFVAIFVLFGLALALAGIAILAQAQVLGGLAAMMAGVALAVYGVKLGVEARDGRFPGWLRDIRDSAPL